MLPVVVLWCQARALIRVNGRAAGEAGPDRAVTFPAAPGEALYLEALPLGGAYLPAVRLLRAPDEAGEPFCGRMEQDVEAVFWPGCVEAVLPVLSLPPEEEPAALLDTCGGEGVQAALFREGGVHLSVEKGEAVLFSRTLARRGGGALQWARGHVIAFAQERCLCLRPMDGRVTLDLTGGEYFWSEGSILRREELATCRRHRLEERYDPFDGRLLSRELRAQRQPESLSEAALSLAEAVKLELWQEAASLLGGELRELAPQELKEFFGPFDRARSHPWKEGVVGLLEKEERRPRVFCFEGRETAGGWRIENAREEE